MNFNHTVVIQQYEAFDYACWSVAIFFSLCSLLICLGLVYNVLRRGLSLISRRNGSQTRKKAAFVNKGLDETVGLPIIRLSGNTQHPEVQQ